MDRSKAAQNRRRETALRIHKDALNRREKEIVTAQKIKDETERDKAVNVLRAKISSLKTSIRDTEKNIKG